MYRKAKRPGRMHSVIHNSLVTHHIHVPCKVLGSVWTPLNFFFKSSIQIIAKYYLVWKKFIEV